MSQILPPAGTHTARLNGQIVVYETTNGALCAAVPCMLGEEDWRWAGKHTMTLVKADGTVQTQTLDTLREVFGWDGDIANLPAPTFRFKEDPEVAVDQVPEVTFSIVGEHEEYSPEGGEPRMTFKIKWLNPLNRTSRMPDPIERKTVLAKYGSKFRALGAAKQPVQAKKAEPPPAEKKSSPPAQKTPPARGTASGPGGTAVTSTMEECWGACQAKHPNITDENELADLFYKKIEELFPGKQNSDLSIQNWGQVKLAFA